MVVGGRRGECSKVSSDLNADLGPDLPACLSSLLYSNYEHPNSNSERTLATLIPSERRTDDDCPFGFQVDDLSVGLRPLP